MATDNSAPGKLYIEDVLQTRYPYVNLTESTVGVALNNFRRSISSVNPFAFAQVPSQDRIAFGIRQGNGFYTPMPYPNSIVFWKMFPSHYDPLTDDTKKERWQVEERAPGDHSHFVFTADKLPRGCIRQLQNFKRCEMVNGKEQCSGEAHEILKVCPTWALDEMKDKQRFISKVAAINTHQYRNALEVSEYNKGRSIKDISEKTWLDGTKDRLRPDTMWADERYSKITQTEINEAKKRVDERNQKRLAAASGHAETHHDAAGHAHHYDYIHREVKQAKPLYP